MRLTRLPMRKHLLAAAVAATLVGSALAQTQRPNILVIMADDVGYSNVGIYSHGMMLP